jgi:hypothetical protein
MKSAMQFKETIKSFSSPNFIRHMIFVCSCLQFNSSQVCLIWIEQCKKKRSAEDTYSCNRNPLHLVFKGTGIHCSSEDRICWSFHYLHFEKGICWRSAVSEVTYKRLARRSTCSCYCSDFTCLFRQSMFWYCEVWTPSTHHLRTRWVIHPHQEATKGLIGKLFGVFRDFHWMEWIMHTGWLKLQHHRCPNFFAR